MNVNRIDLNLLMYLDVLLAECNVSAAAARLGITQPAMSNSLKRLRELLGDPILVRTSKGMQPTAHAISLQHDLRSALLLLEKTVQPHQPFDPAASTRVFRIMASDYTEAVLLPKLIEVIMRDAPNVVLDILTASDVSFEDMEHGRVDIAINRFDRMPNSFHQTTVWHDGFSCLMHKGNPLLQAMNLDDYLQADHVWVSKTGMGKGTGLSTGEASRRGRVDEALDSFNLQRNIRLMTRQYQVAGLLRQNPSLVATIPAKLAESMADATLITRKLPFAVPPFELKMIWSPLLHHNGEHQWLRQRVRAAAAEISTNS